MLKTIVKRYAIAIPALCAASLSVQADINTGFIAYQNKDYVNAAEHFQHSAKLGHAKAQSIMAQLHLHGAGVEKDLIKSYVYFSLAYEQNPDASFEKKAKTIFSQLSSEQQQIADSELAAYKNTFGKAALDQQVMPDISDKPFVLRPGRRINKGLRVSGSPYSVKRTELSSAILEFDVAPDGTSRDIAVAHSYYVNKSGERSMVKASYNFKFKPVDKPLHKAHTIPRQQRTWGQTTVTREYIKDNAPKLSKHIRQLTQFADKGNANAQYELAMYIIAFPAMETSKRKGFELIEKAAQSGHLKATTEYARYLILGKYTKRNIRKGINLLTKTAQAGEVRAQYRLGRELLSGQVVKKDLKKAIFWLQLAVDANDENSKYWLARALLNQAKTTDADIAYIDSLLDEVEVPHENNPNYYYYRAKLLGKQGKNSKAILDFEEALERANELAWDTADWQQELAAFKQKV